jgi:hypothetical protein
MKPIDTLFAVECLREYFRYIFIVFGLKILDVVGLCLKQVISVSVLIEF